MARYGVFRNTPPEKMKELASQNISKAAILKELGITSSPNNYRSLNRFMIKHNIDHKLILRGTYSLERPKIDLELILSNKVIYGSTRLKKRLIKEGLLEQKCSCCGISEWMDRPAPLHLDHINGNHEDNSLVNLRILCPNCHAQTSTYCRGTKLINNSKVSKNAKKQCYRPKKFEVSKEELGLMLESMTYCAIAKHFGVSDKAIHKRALKFGLK